MTKVYCRQCHFFRSWEYGEWCSKVVGYKDTPTHQMPITPEYEKQNAKNDCAFYEPNLWKRFTTWLNKK